MHHPARMLLAALILLTASGLCQGIIERRWSSNDLLPIAVADLSNVPVDFDNWSSEKLSLSDAEVKTGQIAGYVRREYRNLSTDARVGLLIMAGEGRPISLHPPTVCLAGQGYRQVRTAGIATVRQADADFDQTTSSNHEHTFFYTDFRSPDPDDPTLTRLYWAFRTDGTWQAEQNPRLTYAAEPVLFKLYATTRWTPSDTETDTAIVQRFLEEFLLELQMPGRPLQRPDVISEDDLSENGIPEPASGTLRK